MVAAAARIAQLEALVGELLAERVQLRAQIAQVQEQLAAVEEVRQTTQQALVALKQAPGTCTLSGARRAVASQHEALLYGLLFRASAAALQQLAQDPRFLGGQLGMVGVLQPWTRDLRSPPHSHSRVPGGGLATNGRTWQPARADFLVHVKPLVVRLRAQLRAALRQTALWASIPAAVWQQDGVVDGRPVGSGRTALKYLAPYVVRVALSNQRLLALVDGQVTLRYQDGETRQPRTGTLPAEACIDRFLQHILPTGFVTVRSYGLFRVGACARPRRVAAPSCSSSNARSRSWPPMTSDPRRVDTGR